MLFRSTLLLFCFSFIIAQDQENQVKRKVYRTQTGSIIEAPQPLFERAREKAKLTKKISKNSKPKILKRTEKIEFEDGDCAVVIKNDGSIGKVIIPKMDKSMLNSGGYRALLDVLDVLQPGAKEKFIKYNEKEAKGSIH